MEGIEAGGPGAPPSPLSGAYLLIVLGEPHSSLHRQHILTKVQNGFLSWDKDSCHVDLEKELQTLASQSPDGEESKNGERLIQFASENLVTEVLIHPTLNTLTQCVRNLLSSFTRHRHIIHAGYTFTGNGSWIVQDGTFSLADLIDAFQEPDVLRVLRAYENTVSVDVHCAPEGDWSTARMRREPFSKICCVRINPDTSHTPVKNVDEFMAFVGRHLQEANLEQLLEPSDVVGNIRFSHPTLYVFPGGQGDAALFGINGFNMLVDGGFSRRACFWDFTRHLDRLDAVLVTRLNNANCLGMAAVLRRKRQAHVYPQIGHFFCNLQERRQQQSPDTEKEGDSLLVSLADIGQEMVINCRQLQLKPHVCHRDVNIEPINLYHKVGHGKLDMYVISPGKDSRDLKEFLAKWHSNDQALFSGMAKKKGDFQFPLHNLVSICALLVWQPANPSETITRLLFPGSTPQHKIFEGLDKLKHLEFLKHSVCSAKTLSPSSSTLGMATKAATTAKPKPATAVIDKLLPGEGLNKPISRTMPSVESVNKQNIVKSATIPVATPVSVSSEAKQKPATQKSTTVKSKIDKQTTQVDRPKEKTELDEDKEVDKEKEKEKEKNKETEITETDAKVVSVTTKVEKSAKVEGKSKVELKSSGAKPDVKNVKSKIDSRQSVERTKPADRKPSKTPSVEKKTDSVKSSPTTPKKTIDLKPQKGTTARAPTRTRASPTATPAKSAKEENNRKVVESKKTTTAAAKPAPPSKPPKREVSRAEKRPPRRAQAASPSKTIPKAETSPKKAVSRVGKGKGKKEGAKKDKIEPDKATATDSSTVSTPSTADVEIPTLKASEELEKSGNEPESDVKINKDEKKDGEAEEADDVEKLSDRLEDEGIEKDVESTDKGDISDDLDLKIIKDEKSLDGEETGDEKFTKETVGDVKEGICITSAEKDESERDEEDEILVIEKVELEGYDNSTQEPESLESHDVEEIEDELQKHLRDETESEKKLKKDIDNVLEEQDKKSDDIQVEEDKEDEGAVVDASLEYEEEEDKEKIVVKDDEKEKESEGEEKKDVGERKLPTPSSLDLKDQPPQTIGILSPEDKEKIVEEVQGIITSATEFVTKAKLEAKDVSDEQKSSEVKGSQESGSDKLILKTDEKKDDSDEMKEKSKDQGDLKYRGEPEESQPDERLSTTVESGATTAPTLPEDERIPLDEIKEIIEEKHVKEETKEKEVTNIVQNKAEQPTSLPQIAVVGGRGFETKAQIPRDIVKTPDEVADLPVHEEVDAELYVSEEFPGKEFHRSKDELLGVCSVKKSIGVKDEKDVDLHPPGDSNIPEESDVAQFNLKDKDMKLEIDVEEQKEDEKEELIKLPSKALDKTTVSDLPEKQVSGSVLEEQPIHTRLKAPEVPEYVMLSPDSAPESPLPKDETKGLLKDSKIYKEIVSEEKEVDSAENNVNKLESDSKVNISVKEGKEEQTDLVEKQQDDSLEKSSTIQDISKIEVSETVASIGKKLELSAKPASPKLDEKEAGKESLKDTIDSKEALIQISDAPCKDVKPEIHKKSLSQELELGSNILSEPKTDVEEHEIISKDLPLNGEEHKQLEKEEVRTNVSITPEKKIATDKQEKSIYVGMREDGEGKSEEVGDDDSATELKDSKPSSTDPITEKTKDVLDKSPALLDTKASATPEPAEEITKALSDKMVGLVPSESKQSKPVSPEPGFDETAKSSSPTPSLAKSSKSASPEPTEKGIIEPSEKYISAGPSETKLECITPEPADKTEVSVSPTPSEIRGPKPESPEPLEKGSREESALKSSSSPPSEVKDQKAPPPTEALTKLDEICPKKTISPVLSEISTPKSATPEPKDIECPLPKSTTTKHHEEVASAKSITPEPIYGSSPAKSVSPVPEGLDSSMELSEKEKKFLPEKSLSPAPSETKISKPSSPEPTDKDVSSEKSTSPVTFEEKLSDKSGFTKQYEEALSEFDRSELHGQKLAAGPSNVESNLKSSISLEPQDVKSNLGGKIDDKPVSLEQKTSSKPASPEPTSKAPSVKSVSPTPIESGTPRSSSPEKNSKASLKKPTSPASIEQTSKFDYKESVVEDKELVKTVAPIDTEVETKSPSPEPGLTPSESKTPKPASPEPTEKAVKPVSPITFETEKSKSIDLESVERDKKLPSEKSISPVPSDGIATRKSASPEHELQSHKTVASAESEARISKTASTESADDKLSAKSISPVPCESKGSKPASPEPTDEPPVKSVSPPSTEIKASKPASPELADKSHFVESVSTAPSEVQTLKPGSPEPADESISAKTVSSASPEPKLSKPASPEPTMSPAKSASPAPSESKTSKPHSPEPEIKSPTKSESPVPSELKTSEPVCPEPLDELISVTSMSPVPSEVKTLKSESPESITGTVSPVPSEVDPVTKTGSPEPANKSPSAKSISPVPSELKESKPGTPEPIAKSVSLVQSELKASKPGSPEPADRSPPAKSVSPAPSELKESKPGTPEPIAKSVSLVQSELRASKPGSPEPADRSPPAKSVSPAPSELKESKPGTPEPIAKSMSLVQSELKESKPGSPELIGKSVSPVPLEPKASKPGSPEAIDKSSVKSASPAPSEIKTSKPGSPEPANESPSAKSVSPAPSEIKTSKPDSPDLIDKSSAKSASPAPSEIKTSKPGSPEPANESPSAKSVSPAPSEIKTSKPGSPDLIDKSSAKSASPAPSEIKTSKPGSPEPANESPFAKSVSPAPSEIKTSKPGSPDLIDKSSAKSESPAPSEIKTSKPGSPDLIDKSSAKSASPAPSEIKTSKPGSPELADKYPSAKSVSPASPEIKTSKPGSPDLIDNSSVKSVSSAPSEIKTSKPGSPEPVDKTPSAKSVSPAPSEIKTSKSISPEPTQSKLLASLPDSKEQTKLDSDEISLIQNDVDDLKKSTSDTRVPTLSERTIDSFLDSESKIPTRPSSQCSAAGDKFALLNDFESLEIAKKDDDNVKEKFSELPISKDVSSVISKLLSETGEEITHRTVYPSQTEDESKRTPKSDEKKDDQDNSSLIGGAHLDFSSPELQKDICVLEDEPLRASTVSKVDLSLSSTSDSKAGEEKIGVSKVKSDPLDSCQTQKISDISQQKEIGTVMGKGTLSDLNKILLESDKEVTDKGGKIEKEVEDLLLLDKSIAPLGKISPKSISPTSLEIEAKIGLGDDYNKIKPLSSSASETPRSISPLPPHEVDLRTDGVGKSDFMISSSAIAKDIFLKDTKIDDVRPFSTDKTDDIESTLKLKCDAGFLENEIKGKFDSLESYSIEPQKSVKTALQESSTSSILSSKEDNLKSTSPVPSLKEAITKKDSLTDSKVSSKSVSPTPSEVDSKMDDWMKSPSLGKKDLDSKVSSAFGSRTETPKSFSPVPSEKLDLKSVSTPPPSPKILDSSSKMIDELASTATPPKSPVSKDSVSTSESTVLDCEKVFEKVASIKSTPHDISSLETSSIASSISAPTTQMVSSVNGFSTTIDSVAGISSSFTDDIPGKDSCLDSSLCLTKSGIDEVALPSTDKSGTTKVLTDTTFSSMPSTVSDLKTKSDSCVPSDSILEFKDTKPVASSSDLSKVSTSPMQNESHLVNGKVDTSKVSSPFSCKEETSKDGKKVVKDSDKADLLVGLDDIIPDSVKGVESVVSTKVDSLSQPKLSDSTPTKHDDESQDDSSKKVHRMVVTASSEDGGSETELCAGGSISFTTSTDSSDKTPSKDVCQKTSSIKDSGGKDDSITNGISSESQIFTKTLGSKDGEVTTLTTVITPSVKEEVIEKSMTESPEKSTAKKGLMGDVSAQKPFVEDSSKKEVVDIPSQALKHLTGDSKFLGGVVSELKKEAFDTTRSGTPGSETDFDGGISSPRSDISSGQASRALTGSEEHLDSRSSPDSPSSPCFKTFGSMSGSIIGSFKPYAMQFGGGEHGDDYKISQILDDDEEDEHFKVSESSCLKQLPEKFDEKVPSKDSDLKHAITNGQSILAGVNGTGKVGEPSTTTEQSKTVQDKEKDAKSGAASSSSSVPSAADLTSDPIKGWGKPLGLPPPPEEKNRWFPTWDPIEEWGKPLGLPTPAPPLVKKDSSEDIETSASNKTTPKKVAKRNAENNKSASNTTIGKEANTKSKRPESPNKRGNKENKKAAAHIYVDLSYVPHNGNSHYTNVEFFKRVRARYYVFSGTEPSRDVFNALLEAKQTWEDKDLEVTIIPTYDTDVLGYWVAENEEVLAKNKIDLSPSASRCTINLQDHETSCSAYRLEF